VLIYVASGHGKFERERGKHPLEKTHNNGIIMKRKVKREAAERRGKEGSHSFFLI